MRILLDEQIPAAVAEALRARGHDVNAVQERPVLRGLPDGEVYNVAQAEKRAVVTDNVAHFRACADAAYAVGAAHFGLIYLSNRGLPRHRVDAFIREAVQRLDALLSTYTGEEATSMETFL